MPFVVTNVVSCFQRNMNKFITSNNIPNTFAFSNNVYVCGYDKEDHDRCWKIFSTVAKAKNFIFNNNKTIFQPLNYRY